MLPVGFHTPPEKISHSYVIVAAPIVVVGVELLVIVKASPLQIVRGDGFKISLTPVISL